METLEPERFTVEPEVAGSQIIILVADETDIFVAIPDVIVGNQQRSLFHRRRWGIDHGWRSHIYRCRCHIHQWPERHPSIGINDTARHKSRSGCGQDKHS
jgi:hypothetical protein